MTKKMRLLILLLFFVPYNILAQEVQDDFTLMRQAVDYSSRADAYGAYCDQKSNLAEKFIEKFLEKRGISKSQERELLTIKDDVKRKMDAALKEDQRDCKNLEFMMARFGVMNKLKDISYRLSGVDPETLPETGVPNIEELLPPLREL